MTITTIGLDLAKSVLQAHGIDETGAPVLVKKLHRKEMLPFFSKLQPCLIAMEACGTAHHWARTLAAMGHEVRLIPPSYGKAYVKRGKSDALDAEAICEAVQRPTMRFVPVKTVEQQGILMTHRARVLLMRQRTMLANALRAHLAELGYVANPGIANLAEQTLVNEALPSYARPALEILIRQIMAISTEVAQLDQQLATWRAASEASQKLAAIPGLGVITATAIAATVADPEQFKSGGQFAAWLGLTPQQQSTGERRNWSAYRSKATDTRAGYWSWAPLPSCGTSRTSRPQWPTGSGSSARKSPSAWYPWHSPTNLPASRGSCWHARRLTGRIIWRPDETQSRIGSASR